MSNDPRNPPIRPGPYLDPWPVVNPLSTLHRRPMPYSQVGPARGLDGTNGQDGMEYPPNATAYFDLARFNLVNGSKTFTVGTTSTPIIQRPPSWRNYLHFRNASTAGVDMYIEFGAPALIDGAGIGGSGVKLLVDEQILWDASVPQDDVYAIASGAGGILIVSYGVISIPGSGR